jgi:ferritin-like metal-binding protein YciE
MTSEDAKQSYLMGIQSAHSLEKQATQLLGRQLERIESYPEVAAILQQHYAETEHQIQRLDGILSELGSSPSLSKDIADADVGEHGGHRAQRHVRRDHEEPLRECRLRGIRAGDLPVADLHGAADRAPAPCRDHEQTLREEEKTFQTLLGMTDALTAKFMELSLSGARAKT